MSSTQVIGQPGSDGAKGGGGGIGGTISAGQVAFGSGSNTIGGDSGFTYDGTTVGINQSSAGSKGFVVLSGTAGLGDYQFVNFTSGTTTGSSPVTGYTNDTIILGNNGSARLDANLTSAWNYLPTPGSDVSNAINYFYGQVTNPITTGSDTIVSGDVSLIALGYFDTLINVGTNVTYAEAANVYIAADPTFGVLNYALHNAGSSRLDGNISINTNKTLSSLFDLYGGSNNGSYIGKYNIIHTESAQAVSGNHSNDLIVFGNGNPLGISQFFSSCPTFQNNPSGTGQNTGINYFGAQLLGTSSSVECPLAALVYIDQLVIKAGTSPTDTIYEMANLYINAAPIFGTDNYSLHVAGNTRIDANLNIQAGSVPNFVLFDTVNYQYGFGGTPSNQNFLFEGHGFTPPTSESFENALFVSGTITGTNASSDSDYANVLIQPVSYTGSPGIAANLIIAANPTGSATLNCSLWNRGQSRFDGIIDFTQLASNSAVIGCTLTPLTDSETTWTAGVPNQNPDGYMCINSGSPETGQRYMPFWL